MHPIIALLTAFLVCIAVPRPVSAFYDPLSVPNNRFGIHLADVNDIDEAARLVNANGDWGYVTIVISETDRNVGKWQSVMDKLRRLRLIPIIRIATHPVGDSWAVPKEDSPGLWAAFLAALNWPTENRYVVVFNEPNHSKEWGGRIDPVGYGSSFVAHARALKAVSPDFFVLPAGLDSSAASDGEAFDAADYLTQAVRANPEMLTAMDGWTSHAYPNPAFSGSPYAYGRNSIHSYLWETDLLKRLGLTKRLPVFITETGWQHSQGKYVSRTLLSPEAVATYIRSAAGGAWAHPDVVAVTPFVLNYQDYPFDHFSWRMLGSGEYYAQYFAYRDLDKPEGAPQQRESLAAPDGVIPAKLVSDSAYTIVTDLANTGQGIVDPSRGYALTVSVTGDGIVAEPQLLPVIEPGNSRKVALSVKTGNRTGRTHVRVAVRHGTKDIPIEEHDVDVVPPPSMAFSVPLGWRPKTDTAARVLLYDRDDVLVRAFEDVRIDKGEGTLTYVKDVIPGQKYRVVILVPYYLPRQGIVLMDPELTRFAFKRLYPVDFDRNGRLGIGDLGALLTMQPRTVFGLLFGK